MKIILSILIVLLTFASCTNKPAKYKDPNAIKSALLAAGNAEVTEQKCFLGFTFGMNESEVTTFFDSLERNGKVYLSGNTYYYDFTQKDGLIITISFLPKFYNGFLYEMEYGLADKSLGSTGNEHVFMMGAFKDSANSEGFQTFIDDNNKSGNTTYYCIKGNLIITFKQIVLGESVMVYTNAPIKEKVEHENRIETKKNIEESCSEF